MKFKKLFISALAVSTISLAATSTYATDYEINHGDTLWQIAKKYGTTVDNLARINNIQNINMIYAGHKLKIDDETIVMDTPSTMDSSASVSLNAVHTVSLGDTLTNIAKRYNTTVAHLQMLNGIANPHLIYIGQAIRVEGSAFISTEENIVAENVENIELPKVVTEETSDVQEAKTEEISETAFRKVEAVKTEEISAGEIKEDAVATISESTKTEENRLVEEEVKVAEDTKAAEEARQAEEAKLAEEARQAEEAKAAEEARQAEEAKAAEEARQAEETRQATNHSFNANAIVANAYAIAPQRVYVYGANDSTAVDCSSFVQQVYAAAGISIPRVTWSQMAAATPTSDPQPGDLVFFNGGAHVGIYVGNGMMVDALNAGSPVGERPISSIIGSVDGYYTFR